MAVGGAEAVIFEEVLSGRTEELPTLLPDILFTVLVPYIGPEAAGRGAADRRFLARTRRAPPGSRWGRRQSRRTASEPARARRPPSGPRKGWVIQ